MKVALVDYSAGNLFSLRIAIERLGAEAVIASTAEDLDGCSHVIVPGVGKFGFGMQELERRGFREAISKLVDQGIPLLGICLGMHLFHECSEESESIPGYGFFSGKIKKLATGEGQRLPHVGWNDVHFADQQVRCMDSIPSGADFYFVHSYASFTEIPGCDVAKVRYGVNTFNAAITRGMVWGVQFHPEKSQVFGARVLDNFLGLPHA